MALAGASRPALPGVRGKKPRTPGSAGVGKNGVRASVDELKKRWYDLRSRTKERVAERLLDMRGTGGGPSTIPPPTPLEERVEETLEPEAVTGFGELVTSEPGPSTGLPQDTPTSHSSQVPMVSQPREETTEQATTSTCTTNIIHSLATPVATVVLELAPAISQSATSVITGPPPLRRRCRMMRAGQQAESGLPSTTPTEAQLLRGQRLQNQQLGRISGVLQRFERNHANSMQQVHAQLEVIGNNTGGLALSMRKLVAGLLTQSEGARRRDRQLLQRLDRMASSIVRLAVNTTGLSRRTVSLQVDMGHFAGDVAWGLGRSPMQ
ncbi:hypothetical protein NDU88_007429 [Pleurodeles waltl]|uniref:Nuclear apoptosis-inducing factor 1 n=1 Tax=Pleurodeles waltl TaxID=8319 RepID=A0AAV7N5W1_PLEWA|nr:hypothetical protein NDU88_007429 [Pleurodeles waltl]